MSIETPETPGHAQATRRTEIERAIDRSLDDLGRRFVARWASLWPLLLLAVVVIAVLWYLGVHALGALLFVAQVAFVVGFIILVAGVSLWLLAHPPLHWTLPGKARRALDDDDGAPEAVAAARSMATLLQGAGRSEAAESASLALLLVGPAGVGKRTLARGLSAEAEAPLTVVSAARFHSLAIGNLRLDAWRLRSLYRQARRMARAYGACVIYLDDVDTLSADAYDELRRQLAPATLREGRWSSGTAALGVRRRGARAAPTLTIGATTTPDLAWPGASAFDHVITLTPPNAERRAEVIARALDSVPHENDLALPRLVAAFTGYTSVAIQRAIAEAAALAHADGRERVTMRDLTTAREARERDGHPARSPQEQRRLAYSEAGRAVAQVYAQPHRPLGRVAIRRARGRLDAGDAALSDAPRSAEEVYANIEVALASRAAEDLFLQARLENSAAGLARATELAVGYVARWGMGESLGAVATLTPEALANTPTLREQVERLLRRAYNDACALLQEHRAAVSALAEALLERGALYGDEVTEVMRQAVATSPAQMASLASVAETALFGSRAPVDSLAPAPHLDGPVGPATPAASADAPKTSKTIAQPEPAMTAERANGPGAFAASPSQELRADRVIDRAILRAPLRQRILHKTDPNLPAVNSGAGAHGGNGRE